MRMEVMNLDGSIECSLGGPALAAAAGAKLHGAKVKLFSTIPSDLSPEEREVIKRIDSDPTLLHTLTIPALRWVGPRILGELRSSRIIGDPVAWRPPFRSQEIKERTLILSNGDPLWYADLLRDNRPSFVSIDLNLPWTQSRPDATAFCCARAQLVTIASHEL